jgi:hypothetical protein
MTPHSESHDNRPIVGGNHPTTPDTRCPRCLGEREAPRLVPCSPCGITFNDYGEPLGGCGRCHGTRRYRCASTFHSRPEGDTHD